VRHAITFLATGAYVGYLPVAPGTFGSLLGVPLLCLLARARLSVPAMIALLAAVSLASMAVCDRAGLAFADPDSGKIVLDEVCGMLVAGAGIITPVPTATSLLVVFALFRLFDVWKPFPARYLDRRVRNGIGVVGDDLVAGIYANLVARVLT
jgi:phosphatidylglycerophosphatase A